MSLFSKLKSQLLWENEQKRANDSDGKVESMLGARKESFAEREINRLAENERQKQLHKKLVEIQKEKQKGFLTDTSILNNNNKIMKSGNSVLFDNKNMMRSGTALKDSNLVMRNNKNMFLTQGGMFS